MALWGEQRVGLRRIRSLLIHLPAESITLLTLPTGSPSTMPIPGTESPSEPLSEPKRASTPADIEAFGRRFGVPVKVHHG